MHKKTGFQKFLPVVIAVCFLMYHPSIALSQCNCKQIEQDSGSFYIYCNPFISGTDSLGKIMIGISGLGSEKFIHAAFSFEQLPQNFSGGLGITTSDGASWICVLVQRQLKEIGGIATANGLFSITNDELKMIRDKKIQSVTFYLDDLEMLSLQVNYLQEDLNAQLNCLEN